MEEEIEPPFVPPGGPPWVWKVTWGTMGRMMFRSCDVVAFDAEEALVEAARLHPERPRPRVALCIRGAGDESPSVS